MRKNSIVQRIVAVGTSVALAASLGVAPAFAAQRTDSLSYTPPSSKTSLTDTSTGARYATAIGAHGSAVVGEYVGLSLQTNQVYATPGNGVDTTNYKYNPYYGIYGSALNQNPDPYAANLFYNWFQKASSNTTEASDVHKTVDYTYCYVFDGYSGSAYTSDAKTDVEGTSRALSGRPDVLTVKGDAGTKTFTDEIAVIKGFKDSKSEYYKAATDTYVGDENYDPVFAGYKETKLPSLVESVYDEAATAKAAVEKSTAKGKKVTLRYGDPMVTAEKYEKLIKGSNLYVLSKIADGTVARKTVAFVTSVNADGTITLASSVDPMVSGEQTHNIEPTVATCDNLADVLYKEKNGTEITRAVGKNNIVGEKSASVQCTAAELARADAILLTNPDNIAYYLDPANGKVSDAYSANSIGTDADKGYANLSKDGNDGSTYSRSYTVDGKQYYKNQYYGPQAYNTNLVSSIRSALNGVGTPKATALAAKPVMQCVGENASAQDGGSVDAMDLHPIINAFVYPELMNQAEQFGYFLYNIAHIKSDSVGTAVNILAQDMSMAEGVSSSDIKGDFAATNTKIEAMYDEGLQYYVDHKDAIDAQYPWLQATANLTLPAATPKAVAPTVKKNLKYTGSEQVGVAEGTGYTLSGTYKATKVGKNYTATATLVDGYVWSDGTKDPKTFTWSIVKADQKVTYKLKSVPTAKALKKATKKINVTFSSTSGKAVTFKAAKVSSKKGTVSIGKNGKTITVKKGTKKGNYNLKLAVNVKGDDNYNAVSSKVLTVKVVIK